MKNNIRNKVASAVGSIGEWYDFSLYSFFIPVISKVFFPSSSNEIGLLKAFSVLAIGFLARPFGAIIFGYVSDKFGRSVSLKITPILITLPTFCISLLPSYEKVGLVSPLVLILLRFIQGIAIGGEHSNNIIYLCESGSKKNLFFLGSLASCAGSSGILLASLVSAFCFNHFSDIFLTDYGWRIAFSSSVIIGFLTILMRRRLPETAEYNSLPVRNSNPLKHSLLYQKKDYLKALGIIILPASSFYFIFVFLPNNLNSSLGYSSSKILGDNAFSLAIRLCIIPLIGLIADRVGGLRVANFSSWLFFLLTIPLIYIIYTYPPYLEVSILSLALLTTLSAATTPGILVKLLPGSTRSSVLSVSFNVGFGIFGGLTPIICQELFNSFDCLLPAFFITGIAGIGIIATSFCKKEFINVRVHENYR